MVATRLGARRPPPPRFLDALHYATNTSADLSHHDLDEEPPRLLGERESPLLRHARAPYP